MAQKSITIVFFISVDIDSYHDKCQIFISFKFKLVKLVETRPLIFLNKIHIKIEKCISKFLHSSNE